MIQQGCAPTRADDDLLIVSLTRPLRRVWKPTAVLCAVLSLSLAGLFWSGSRPVFESQATVSLQPFKASVINRPEDAAKLGVFESLISAQAIALKSEDLIKQIIQHHDESGETIPGLPKDLNAGTVLSGLWVVHPEESMILHLHYRDPSARKAKAIVDLVATGYTAVYDEKIRRLDRERLARMQTRYEQLVTERDGFERDLLALVRDRDVDALKQSRDVYGRLIANIEQELIQAQSSSNIARVARKTTAATTAQAQNRTPDAEIGNHGPQGFAGPRVGRAPLVKDPNAGPALTQSRDVLLDQYLIQLSQAQTQMTAQQHRLGEGHQNRQHLASRIDELSGLITHRMQLHLSGDSTAVGADGLSGPLPWSLRQKVYEEQVAYYEDTLQRLKQDFTELDEELDEARAGKEQGQQLRANILRANQDLETVLRQMENLRIEQDFGSLAQVVRRGNIGGPPASDPRKSMALSGLILGALISVGGMLAFAWLDPRCHHPDQLAKSVATLPHLGTIDGPDTTAALAQLHRCRHELTQALRPPAFNPEGTPEGTESPPRLGRVVTLATPKNPKHVQARSSAGELAAALGVSASTARQKTLLIDLDRAAQQAGELLTAAFPTIPSATEQAVAHLEQAQRLTQQLNLELSELASDHEENSPTNLPERNAPASCLGRLLDGETLNTQTPKRCGHALDVITNDLPENAPQWHAFHPQHLSTLLDEARSRYDLVVIVTRSPEDCLLATAAWSLSDFGLIHLRRHDPIQAAQTLAGSIKPGQPVGFVFDTGNTHLLDVLETAVLMTPATPSQNQDRVSAPADAPRPEVRS